MPRIRKNKKQEEVKNTKVEPEIVETPTVETPEVEQPVKPKKKHELKDYVVVLGTPGFYVVQLEDGSMKTIQGSNNYKRGDIVKL